MIHGFVLVTAAGAPLLSTMTRLPVTQCHMHRGQDTIFFSFHSQRPAQSHSSPPIVRHYASTINFLTQHNLFRTSGTKLALLESAINTIMAPSKASNITFRIGTKRTRRIDHSISIVHDIFRMYSRKLDRSGEPGAGWRAVGNPSFFSYGHSMPRHTHTEQCHFFPSIEGLGGDFRGLITHKRTYTHFLFINDDGLM